MQSYSAIKESIKKEINKEYVLKLQFSDITSHSYHHHPFVLILWIVMSMRTITGTKDEIAILKLLEVWTRKLVFKGEHLLLIIATQICLLNIFVIRVVMKACHPLSKPAESFLESPGCWSLSHLLLGDVGVHSERVTSLLQGHTIQRYQLWNMFLGCRRKPTHAWGEHANFTLKEANLDLNQDLLAVRANHYTTVQPFFLKSSLIKTFYRVLSPQRMPFIWITCFSRCS